MTPRRGTLVPEAPQMSIVVAAYNAQPYLARAIESVLVQTAARVELVVVDDGSLDNTARVGDQYADRLVWIAQNNRGASAARNAAIGQSRAPVIAVLDADDWLEPDYAVRVLEAFEADSALDVVFCNTTYRGDNARSGSTTFQNKPPPDTLTLRSALSPNTSFCVAGAYRRRVIDLVGRGYSESLEAAEDLDFFLRALLRGAKFRFLPQPLYNYLLRPGSLTHSGQKLARCTVAALEHIKADFDLDPEQSDAIDESIAYYRRDWARAAMSDALAAENADAFRTALKMFLQMVPVASRSSLKGYASLAMSAAFPKTALRLLRRVQ